MWPSWQPPAFSPLPGAALGRALAAPWQRDDPRPHLEAMLRDKYDARAVHLSATGTMALEVAIRLARVHTGGGVVALPAYGCFDIATAAIGADVRVALYDLDPETLAPDLDSLTAVMSAGARTVVVAPIAGIPVDWESVTNCAAAFGAVLVEDAAQGHGARWRHRPLGSLGQISVLSFGRGKGWTGGRGGAVLIRDPVLAEFARGLSLPEAGVGDEAATAALALAQSFFVHPALFALPAHAPFLHLGETRYRAPRRLTRMSRAAAAIVVASADAASQEAARRRGNAAAFLELLQSRAFAAIPMSIAAEAVPGYLRLPVRVPHRRGGRDRAGSVARHGVAPGYPGTLATIPALRERQRLTGAWPGAATLVRELVTLPTHRWISTETRAAIVEELCGGEDAPVAVAMRASA